jgi:hypothetical protein
VERLRTTRFLAVIGPSGSGKSSVVRAGLLPAVRRGALDGSSSWRIAEMYPGAHPLEELEAALLRGAEGSPISLIETLERDEHGLLRAIKRVAPEDGSDVLLFVDQFEEIFTLVEDERRRSLFLDGLRAAADDPRSRLRVVIAMRADFYDRPLRYRAFGELMRSRIEPVLPLAPAELEQEWSILADVLTAVCESDNAAPEATAWLARAVAAARTGTVALAGGHGAAPKGVVTALVFSSLVPKQPVTERLEDTV